MKHLQHPKHPPISTCDKRKLAKSPRDYYHKYYTKCMIRSKLILLVGGMFIIIISLWSCEENFQGRSVGRWASSCEGRIT
jgi:hypothetical protein